MRSEELAVRGRLSTFFSFLSTSARAHDARRIDGEEEEKKRHHEAHQARAPVHLSQSRDVDPDRAP